MRLLPTVEWLRGRRPPQPFRCGKPPWSVSCSSRAHLSAWGYPCRRRCLMKPRGSRIDLLPAATETCTAKHLPKLRARELKQRRQAALGRVRSTVKRSRMAFLDPARQCRLTRDRLGTIYTTSTGLFHARWIWRVLRMLRPYVLTDQQYSHVLQTPDCQQYGICDQTVRTDVPVSLPRGHDRTCTTRKTKVDVGKATMR